MQERFGEALAFSNGLGHPNTRPMHIVATAVIRSPCGRVTEPALAVPPRFNALLLVLEAPGRSVLCKKRENERKKGNTEMRTNRGRPRPLLLPRLLAGRQATLGPPMVRPTPERDSLCRRESVHSARMAGGGGTHRLASQRRCEAALSYF